ncbi:MAG TPA: hypothetical protein VJQ43_02990, partial [Thermoplasmata archaeon]|nr:hypothetical protein [Thermoplasmata archaeon]
MTASPSPRSVHDNGAVPGFVESASSPVVSQRAAGTACLILSAFGTLAAVLGALRYLPSIWRLGIWYGPLAPAMVIITVSAMFVGAAGVVAGWALLRGRAWGGPAKQSVGVLTQSLGVYIVLLTPLFGVLYPVGLFLLVTTAPAWGALALLLLPRSLASRTSVRSAE